MADDIRAEAERLGHLGCYARVVQCSNCDARSAEIAAALRRQLAEGFMLGCRYADKEGAQYQRGLEDGAREERERIEEYILDWRKDGLRLKCKPGVNLNDGLDDLRWLLNYIRARGEKP